MLLIVARVICVSCNFGHVSTVLHYSFIGKNPEVIHVVVYGNE